MLAGLEFFHFVKGVLVEHGSCHLGCLMENEVGPAVEVRL